MKDGVRIARFKSQSHPDELFTQQGFIAVHWSTGYKANIVSNSETQCDCTLYLSTE